MKDEFLHIENWKKEAVSIKQLELNLRELSSHSNYPPHWIFFIEFIKKHNFKSVLDIGCGIGAYAKLIKDNDLNIDYKGIDYSKNAIEIAKKQWNFGEFECQDFQDLAEEQLCQFDLVHMGALLDVLPDGNEALRLILSKNPKNVLISRIEITKNPSHYSIYNAYDTITTYSFKHNQKELILMFEELEYDFEFLGNNIYLKKSSQNK